MTTLLQIRASPILAIPNTVFTFPGLLYAITPDLAERPRLLTVVEAALSAGVSMLQYRDKISPMAEKLVRARALAALCHQQGAKLIVNDDVVLAVACGADGVHLGGTDGSVRDARRLLPSGTIIGASCYNDLGLAQQAVADGASYVAFGACFDSPTKPAARRVSLEQLAAFRQALGAQVAICGIGGITLDNVAQLEGKVDAIALISELFGTPDQPTTPERVRDRVRQFMAEPVSA
jgi:thiamine-phosphate pyrophosphorylase